MAGQSSPTNAMWSSRHMFILAAAGSAVGLAISGVFLTSLAKMVAAFLFGLSRVWH